MLNFRYIKYESLSCERLLTREEVEEWLLGRVQQRILDTVGHVTFKVNSYLPSSHQKSFNIYVRSVGVCYAILSSERSLLSSSQPLDGISRPRLLLPFPATTALLQFDGSDRLCFLDPVYSSFRLWRVFKTGIC